MILNSLYIQKYKKYHDKKIIFQSKTNNKLQDELFGKMNVTLFVGENGSGKTTILSFITMIFRYLQRYRERIPCEFILKYQIGNNNENDIEITSNNEEIFITINGDKYLLMEFDLKKKIYIQPLKQLPSITYDSIKEYLPSNLVVLGFDTDYRIDYASNYYGDKLLEIMDLNTTYTKSGFGLDISLGILRFFNMYYRNDDIRHIFENLGFNFADYISIYFNFEMDNKKSDTEIKKNFKYKFFTQKFWNNYIDHNITNCSIFNINKFLEENAEGYNLLEMLIKEKLIYINEFHINRWEKEISLEGMSTGEKIFLCRLFFMLSKIEKDSIVIFEEPETHLNYLWIRHLMPLFSLFFSKFNIHLLISSHSYQLINMLFPSQILLLDNFDIINPNFNTFLANEREIIIKLFNKKDDITLFEDKILSMMFSDNLCEHKKVLLDQLGESFLRYLLFQQIDKEDEDDVESH